MGALSWNGRNLSPCVGDLWLPTLADCGDWDALRGLWHSLEQIGGIMHSKTVAYSCPLVCAELTSSSVVFSSVFISLFLKLNVLQLVSKIKIFLKSSSGKCRFVLEGSSRPTPLKCSCLVVVTSARSAAVRQCLPRLSSRGTVDHTLDTQWGSVVHQVWSTSLSCSTPLHMRAGRFANSLLFS